MDACTTTTTPAPLSFFNRRSYVGGMTNRHSTSWSRLQSRHAEKAKEQSHQRSYHYSLHKVCLPFLLSSWRDERDLSTPPLRRPRDRSVHHSIIRRACQGSTRRFPP